MRISIQVLITDVEINGKGINENFLMNGELPGEGTSVPVCNEVIFNGDGSVSAASCQQKPNKH